MTESFGTRLRQQREKQAIALSSIAERTKINLALLEGLERDDVSHWPSGIFRRSFMRAYAQLIGLDPEPVVREFLERYPDTIDDPAVISTPPDGVPPSQRPPMRLRYLIASAVRSLSRSEPQASPQPAPVGRITSAPAPIQLAAAHAIDQPQRATIAPDARTTTIAPWARETDTVGEIEAVDEIEAVNGSEAIDGVESVLSPDPGTNLSAVAQLCTRMARVLAIREVAPLLESAATLLDAVGMIVWVWDPQGTSLRPALAHGYSDEVLAKLPRVRRDADNATAASFRSTDVCIVSSSDEASGAVVVPLLTPDGCVGVLAVEVRQGAEQKESIRALAKIFAAQLASSVGFAPLAEAVNA
jgi:hypothetical protein